MEVVLCSVVIIAAVVFAIVNGGHDAPNTVALAVRTRAMTVRAALLLAAVFNFFGGLLGTGLAMVFITQFNLSLPESNHSLLVLLVATVVAIAWGVFTWVRGVPSSSTHALVAGLLAGSVVSHLLDAPNSSPDGFAALWQVIIAPLLLSPVLAFVLAYLGVEVVKRLTRKASQPSVREYSRMGQAVAAAAGAFGHGVQDAQRTTAIIMLALMASGWAPEDYPPVWVTLLSASALALGTLLGGWPIARTLAERLATIDVMRAMVATTTSAAIVIFGGVGFNLHLPVASTHTTVAAIVGAGSNQVFGTVRWQQAWRIGWYWLLTPIVCAVLAGILVLAINPLEQFL